MRKGPTPCYAAVVSLPPQAGFARTPNERLALEHDFPGLATRLWRYPLTVLPTPVQRLQRLGEARGIASLWVKCDDRSCELYGGNKPRKLEWLLGDALRRRRSSVLTFGGLGTHHGLATAICARDAGLAAILVLVPQPLTDAVRRCLLLDQAYDAELHLASGVLQAGTTAARRLLRGALRSDRPVLVPPGGSSAVGTIGYVNAGLEIALQVKAGELPEPDWIFVPLGSGGTVAGLLAGLKLAGLASRVAAVLVSDILPPSAGRILRLARATLRRMRRVRKDLPRGGPDERDLRILRGHLGAGYGAVTEEALRAQALAGELAGIRLETTYTAKCLAALLDAAAGDDYRGRNLLFWNTYSSVDPGARVRLPAPSELPPTFHQFFATA